MQTHKHFGIQCQNSPTKSTLEGPVQWDSIKYGKFVAGSIITVLVLFNIS